MYIHMCTIHRACTQTLQHKPMSIYIQANSKGMQCWSRVNKEDMALPQQY